MNDSVIEELRRRVSGRDDETEIEAAFSDVDAKLGSLIELIDFAHEARAAELEQVSATIADLPPRNAG